MRRALNRFYYSTDKHSLPTAYQLMLREFYCDEQGCLLDHYPSFYQFRYFFRKHRYASNELISRAGIRAYQKNGRATTGSVRDGVTGPGIYQMDATLCDIFLVSQFSETQVVGRPILYMAIDVMTQLIVGVSVGFEGGYGGLSDCLYHTLSDKVADCSELDIEIQADQWPAHHLPKEMIVGEVQPVANKLWNWFMSRPEFDLNVVAQQELRFSLLPTAQATLTARGLKFQDAYYYHPSYTSRFVQAKATGEEDSYIPFQLATPYQRYESMTPEEMAVLRKIEKTRRVAPRPSAMVAAIS